MHNRRGLAAVTDLDIAKRAGTSWSTLKVRTVTHRPRFHMCQLLGMNCNVPTDICFSFAGFRSRGGLTAEHRDGWGIAFFEDLGCRVFIDTASASHSPIAQLVHDYPIRSRNVIAHIRRATQ